jgi:flagellar basal-body rod protein FlgB
MFVQRLINQGNAPLLERMMRFTQQRHKLLAENIANASTPGYQQKDLSLTDFQKRLRDRVAMRKGAAPGSVSFDDLRGKVENPRNGVLFHDRNNRSMEQLQTDLASNAMRHNFYVELLRKQFNGLNTVLKERVE